MILLNHQSQQFINSPLPQQPIKALLFVWGSLRLSQFHYKVVPREWLLENNARLLILSGNNICFTFMASKAVNGRAVELARLVVFLALVSAAEQPLLSLCSQICFLRLEICFPIYSYDP